MNGLSPSVLRGSTFSLVPSRGLLQAAQPKSMSGESAGFSGAMRNEGNVGEPLAEHGAERDVGNGVEKGSNVEVESEFPEGSALRAKGSQSGEGKGSQLVKGLVGEGWYPRAFSQFGLRAPTALPPPAEIKLHGSMRCRIGEGRGLGMTLTSRRLVLGLQSPGLG